MRAFANTSSRLNWKRLVGILCVLLVFASGTLQATHFHPSERIAHDCSLCVAAHSSAQVAVFAIRPEPLRPTVMAADPKPLPRHRIVALTLYTRPPPAGSAHS